MTADRRRARFVLVAAATCLLAVLVTSCRSDRQIRELIDQNPVKQLSFYGFDPSTPMVDRITRAPDELLDLYGEFEDERPTVYTPSAEERDEIVAALEALPVRHQEVLQDRLIGIYCVDDFAGTGMADWVLGPDDEIYANLVLHRRVFDTTAADLIDYRASSAFTDTSSSIDLVVELSDWVSLLQYITLHETTHIVDYVDRYTPFVEPSTYALQGVSRRDTTFTDQVWRGYSELRRRYAFEYQPKLRFYGLGAPEISDTLMDDVYTELAAVPVASLYGAMNWAEDFAEFVTFYYLVHTLGADYSISVVRNGEALAEFRSMERDEVIRRAELIDPALVTAPVAVAIH